MSLEFCGSSWANAIENCSPETNCKDDSDCPDGTCHGFLPGCDLGDMLNDIEEETVEEALIELTENDPTNHYFCGSSW
jgi:hypothetical protein